MFNELGDLVAAWLTGSADDVIFDLQLEAGLTQDPANPSYLRSMDPIHRDPTLVWYVPAGTTDLEVKLAGIPTYFDPIFTNAATEGITGAPFYEGTWTLEVDTVNWYRAQDFYPPVLALLQGESYHILCEEPYPYGWTGEALSANHLGPFSQAARWVIPNTRIDSEISAIYSVDLNGYIQGEVLAMTWSDEARSASWIRVAASNSRFDFATYSLDGFFDMYLVPGSYSLSLTEWTTRSEGHHFVTTDVTVGSGSELESFRFILDQSRIPLNELLCGGIFMVPTAMALCLILPRKRGASKTESRDQNQVHDREVRCS
jgi:hypothetical protein